jgi:hypothetical protein
MQEPNEKECFNNLAGYKEVSRNESQKGLLSIQKHIQMNLNTNVFVLSLPKRRDLEDQSCVNK